MNTSHEPTSGFVYLVGGGPGDPRLLTLRGAECLRRADVVLYDYLVNPQILEHVGPGAKKICLGKHGRTRIWTQAEINDRLVLEARGGKTVVRLKGGDPVLFARLAEELDALGSANIPYEIVPGITSALAAASYAGIPITQRDGASALALVTGQERTGKPYTSVDYNALAKFPGTLAFYMGVTTAPAWSGELLRQGMAADTPVLIVRRASLSDQTSIATTLGAVADVLSRLRPPAIVIVGEVAKPKTKNQGIQSSWFTARPLFGQTVLVARPVHQAAALVAPLQELGADVLLQPAIEIGPPDDWSAVDQAIAELSAYQWLVFSSSNGVNSFLKRLLETGHDLRSLGDLQLAAVGPGTARALKRYHLQADVCPREHRAEDLAAALLDAGGGDAFLLVRGSRGREVLEDTLQNAGKKVTKIVAYLSQDTPRAAPLATQRMAANEIDWTIASSSAIAKSLVRLFGESLRKTRLASISPITTQTLNELGFQAEVEATEYTMPGIVDAILQAVGARENAPRKKINKEQS